MSKPASKKSFKYTPSGIAPAISTFKTEWDLSSLFYHSETDPRLEQDVANTEIAISAFARRYQKKPFTDSPATLAKALKEYFALNDTPGEKALYYLFYRHTLDADDHTAERLIALYSERFTKANNQILFFELTIGKLPKKTQTTFLRAPELQPYRHYLTRVFLTAKHTLSEAEEKIMSLKSAPARSFWVSGTEKILKRRTVTYKRCILPLMEAIDTCASLPNVERPVLWRIITDELKRNADIAENELNAIVTDKKINDELRGYQAPYEAKIQSYENDRTSVEALVSAITTKGFAASRKFYAAKAALHQVEQLPYASRYDSIGQAPPNME
jgi:oligoendopeptidase F